MFESHRAYLMMEPFFADRVARDAASSLPLGNRDSRTTVPRRVSCIIDHITEDFTQRLHIGNRQAAKDTQYKRLIDSGENGLEHG